ncbi:DUF1028 domain-containing protein [Acinetobacter baumannii]|uniref:DUF1028 domain-containing protein n=1 Tax=Acinetobacter baumannii TaxID=470 RepID=A0A505MQ69_ACIBA|nr:DUF1028 domain-containing protein [Acinetobacter baumannii]EJB8495729.1 DUF1028 domain-containing protein [Acinetobacter baumannii]ELB0341878.1 DUF1028 domain-containing protein [Acinetobacter baumannii]KCY24491.1 hypothetical protein J635_0097 [Acinetobacter baumannii 233846]MCJ8816189.1 DUF1028 domain-containing protein [Acinetobacter baumannii]MCJ8987363.1 DUF1028 domain-containing protein [Acinetobacter baumannii]
MTFSIIARCHKTEQFGGAICSSSPAVAARCLQAKAGVGVATSQNITDPKLANILLDMTKYDLSPEESIAELVKNTEFIEYRQLTLINADEKPAAFSGKYSLGVFSQCIGEHAVGAGNLLAKKEIPQIMVETFHESTGSLAERLMTALKAGLAAGGESGPVHSAGLLVVDKMEWPVINLRVDWSETPIEDLYQLWKVYEPQVEDYVVRAINPASSPSYGVPGDE